MDLHEKKVVWYGVAMALDSNIRAIQVLTENLCSAISVKERVRIAGRIFEAIGQFESDVEDFVVTGSDGGKRSQSVSEAAPSPLPPSATSVSHRKFSEMKLADIGRVLLTERGVLHGKEIEDLAKAGGFKSESENFQSYLAVAFQREGGFENLGKNRWRLNHTIHPKGRSADGDGGHKNGASAPVAPSNGIQRHGSRTTQIHEWLRANGPVRSRQQISQGTGIPKNTVDTYTSKAKDLFEIRDGMWYAR
jgi:hypothetical protein